MRVFQWEKGHFPNIRMHALAVPCYHCENPPCQRACPGAAIHKDERFGAVLVDAERCMAVRRREACRQGWQACSYGAPQFPSDDLRATMSKCTMCVDRLYEGQRPVCVLSCSLRALDVDTLENLQEWYGPSHSIEDLPQATKAKPAVVFRSHDAKRQLVAWNAGEVLRLWRQRAHYAPEGLPPLFESADDVVEIPAGVVGRGKLVLKPGSVEELMYYTRDDD